MKLEEVFKDEMRSIVSDKVREFVANCNSLVPEYFWEHPASTTGKYHPEISLGKCGLIRHVKLAVWWGVEIYRCWPNTYDGMLDEIVCSLILHDIQKNGKTIDSRGYPTLDNATKVHGVLLARQLGEIIQPDGSNPEIFSRIIDAVASHMGIWTADEFEDDRPENRKEPKTRMLCYIVHLADYCASRKCDNKAKQLVNFDLKGK